MRSSSEGAPPRRVLLFDVDGTLVHAAGAGRRSLERVLHAEVGPLDHSLARLRLDGMTDRLIVREVLGALGRSFDDALCDRVLEAYVEALRVEIEGPGFQVLPGVEELLQALAGAGVARGLCTGNVAEGALLKLRRGGLDGFFEWGPEAVGGFADDGEDRARIVAAAVERAARRLGPRFRAADALVIGDTPRDVEAARAVGVPVLAVATGRFGAAELRDAGADRVVATLQESAATLVAWATGGAALPGA
jgi:phosphoglycolate phosphatase-like HAD superfamily hydrolase